MTPCDPPAIHETPLYSSNPGNPGRQVSHSSDLQCKAFQKPITTHRSARPENPNEVLGIHVCPPTRLLYSLHRSCSGDVNIRRGAHGLASSRAVQAELTERGCGVPWVHGNGMCNPWRRCKESRFSASKVYFETQLSHHANVSIRNSLAELLPFLWASHWNDTSCKTSLSIEHEDGSSHEDTSESDDMRGDRSVGLYRTQCNESNGFESAIPIAAVAEQPVSTHEVCANMRWIEYVRHGLKAHAAADQHVSRTGIVSNLKVGDEYTCMLSPNAIITEIMASPLDRAQVLISSSQSSVLRAEIRESIANSLAVNAAARAADAEMWAMDAESRATRYERRANDAEIAARAAQNGQHIAEQHAQRAQDRARRAQAQAECDRHLLSVARKEASEERRKRHDVQAVARDLENLVDSESEARHLAEEQANADRAALQKLHELELRAVHAEEKTKRYRIKLSRALEQRGKSVTALEMLEKDLVRADTETDKCLKAQAEAEKRVEIYLRSLEDAQSLTEMAKGEVERLRKALANAEETVTNVKEKARHYRGARQEAERQTNKIEKERDRYAEALEKANRKTSKAEAKAEEYRTASNNAQSEAYNAIQKANRNRTAQRAAEKRLEDVERELSWYVDALNKAKGHVKQAEAFAGSV